MITNLQDVVTKRVVMDLDLCIGCGSCAAACYYGHAAMPVVTFANPGPTRLPVICRQCKSPSCVDSCNFSAMLRDEQTGVISRALFRCRGCGSCSRGCPFGLIPPELRAHQVPIAVETDSNPGSSPTASLQLMMSMACHFFKLTVPEVLAGVTTNAAKALGVFDQLGEITVGKRADLVLWDTDDSSILCYHFGMPVAHKTMLNGHWFKPEQHNTGG